MFPFLTDTLFPAVVNMSVTAGIVVLFVLAARLILKKAPKIFSYALWAVVLFRLLCPVSITADFSLLGFMNTSSSPVTEHTGIVEHIPLTDSGITAPVLRPSTGQQNPPVTEFPAPDAGASAPEQSGASALPPTEQPPPVDVIPPSTAPQPQESEQSEFSLAAIACTVWLAGVAAMLIYSAVSLLLLHRKLADAAKVHGNIYLSDHINTPFVMGLFPARVYLPSTLTEQEQRYILLHEQHHIRRLDHIVKALAFLALCIHWFNPLIWLAFVLSGKDMEMSCDEAVMKQMTEDIRAEYSASLLSLATGRRIIAGTPLAFGEGSTGSRIRNILNWKKPKAWILPIAAVLCAAVVVFCAVNPGKSDTPDTDTPEHTGDADLETEPSGGQNGAEEIPAPLCEHSGFRIAFDSQPTRFTVVDWFYSSDLLSECTDCEKSPFDLFATQTSFSDCLEGLKSGKYDVALLPCSSDILASLEGYTVVPIQRDAVIFVRSNSSDLVGYDLTDGEIRRAFTSGETVFWDEGQTDPIIPASGWHDSATLWQQIYRLFGFSPTSPNVVFIEQNQDNAPMAIADSGRSGSGLWPYYFSCRSGEAALNGEPISVNGVYPSAESIADGSYPYSFTYYAVYASDSPYASEIEAFVSYIRTKNYDLFETMDTLRFLPLAWERDINRNDGSFSIVGLYDDSERSVVVNGILLQCLRDLHDQLRLPMNPNYTEVNPCGIRIDIGGSYQRRLSLYPDAEFPCVWIFMESAKTRETSVVYSPQLYLYLTALEEKENATLEDPDSDGFFEVFLWDYRTHDLVIYDYYDDSVHRISTNETIGCSASNYTGLIANIQPKYANMIQAQDEDGQVSVYYYKNGVFTYVCPMSTALGQEMPEEVNTALTEEELAYFESLFVRSNGQGRTFSQMLLSCEYTSPALIDLSIVFREGVPGNLDGVWGYAISDAEKAALRTAMGAAYHDDCHKIPRSVMESLLTEHLGLSLADTHRIGLGQFTYLEQYDAYYICCSTTGRVVPDFHSGIRRTDGMIELLYQKKTSTSSNYPNSTHVLLLREVGDSYRFVANVRALKPGMTLEPYSVMSRGAQTVNELSQSENEQVFAALQDFFTLHAASIAGVDLDPSGQIESTLYHYVRRCADVLRAEFADTGNQICRCSTQYEVTSSQYDDERLTLTIKETAELYYYPDSFVTPVFTSSSISVDHVLCFTKTQDGGFYLAAQMNDMRYTHYYPASGSVISHTEGVDFTGSHLDLLPTVTYSRIRDGFLYTPTGNGVWAIHYGVPVMHSFDYWTIPLNHNGREIPVSYGWVQYGTMLAACSNSPDYTVAPVPGSSRYLTLVIDGGYTYLIDTATGTILDPLAALGDDAYMRLHSVSFSPDGQYAVVSHHSATVCVLLNCATGEITQLPYASDIYSVSGSFADEETIILISAFEIGAPHEIEYRIARYNITTGALTEYPGQYTAKDRSAPNFLVFSDFREFAYTFENGRLVIVDPMTFERTATQVSSADIQSVFYCPNYLAGVICDGIVYILDYDGNAHAVCRTE